MEIKSFNMSNFSQIECPACTAKLYAEKLAEYWYCGYCGKRIDLKASEELRKKENELLAKESELRIKESALKKKEEALKLKEAELIALENGEEFVAPAETGPTYKATASAVEGDVPKLNRPDTVFNSPEMRFNQLSQQVPPPVQPTPQPVAPVQEQKPAQPTPKPVAPVQEQKPVQPTSKPVAPVQEQKPVQPTPQTVAPAQEQKTEPSNEVKKATVKPVKVNKDGKKVEFELEDHTLVKYNGTITRVNMPGDVWKIGSEAFRGNENITGIICDEQVKEIDNFAFQNCTSLSEVVLPSELQKIKYKTFYGCKSLKSIKIPKSVEEIMTGSLVCGLEEIIFESPETQWDTGGDVDAAFDVDRNESGKGVRRIIFNGITFNAADVFKYKTLAGYFKSAGLCQHCGIAFSGMFNKCPMCKQKKDY